MKKYKWEIAYEYYTKGMTKTDACKKAGCALSTLRHTMTNRGLPEIPRDEYRMSMKSEVDFRNMNIIAKAKARGVSVKKICEEEGVNPSNFYSWARQKEIQVGVTHLRREKRKNENR